MSLIKPTSPALRREWEKLRPGDRLNVIDIVLKGIDQDVPAARARMRELGVSEELTNWLIDQGQELQHSIRRGLLKDQIQRKLPRAPADYFNKFLACVVLFLLASTWFVQEVIYFRTHGFPVALPFATIIMLVTASLTVRRFFRWLRALRQSK